MSELPFYATFIATSLGLYAVSLYLRIKYSGHKYTQPKFWLSATHNLTLAFLHYRFAETGQIPFIGYMENSVMGYLSLALILLHVGTLPTPSIRRPWFRRKNLITQCGAKTPLPCSAILSLAKHET